MVVARFSNYNVNTYFLKLCVTGLDSAQSIWILKKNRQCKIFIDNKIQPHDAHFGLIERYNALQKSNWTWLQMFTLRND